MQQHTAHHALSFTCFISIAFACLHLLIANHAGLTVDGAHYALYGKHLALSYYDHPPLVGYLQAIMLCFGKSEWVLRLMPIVLSAAWIIALYFLSADIFPTANAWQHCLASVLGASAVLLNAMALALIPQVPLLLFGLLSLMALQRALKSDRLMHWTMLGILLGLAGLSEYTTICIAFSALIYVLLQKPSVLLHWKPWVAFSITLLMVSPVFIWNSQHDWISIKFQLAHGHHGQTWQFSRFIQSELIQFVSYSPGFIVLISIALVSHLKDWRSARLGLLVISSLSILLLFAYASGYQKTLPHWPALGWIIACPLASHWIIIHWQKRFVRYLTIISLSISFALILFFHIEIYAPFLPFKDYENPLVDLYGWPEVAAKAKTLLHSLQDKTHNPTLGLFVPNWSLGSRLAFYTDLPVQIATKRQGIDQFTLWYGNPKPGASGLLVVPHAWGVPPETGKIGQFQTCRLLDTLSIARHNHLINDFHFYDCSNFKAPNETPA